MYELMCWCWSNKPHRRPSFAIIRQLALSQPFTRLHYAMRVEPARHLVTAIAVRYYEVYYGTDYGIVSVTDLRQSASSCQVIQLVM